MTYMALGHTYGGPALLILISLNNCVHAADEGNILLNWWPSRTPLQDCRGSLSLVRFRRATVRLALGTEYEADT